MFSFHMFNSIDFLQEAVSLYMPGLSYIEMVTYAARLRTADSHSSSPGRMYEVNASVC